MFKISVYLKFKYNLRKFYTWSILIKNSKIKESQSELYISSYFIRVTLRHCPTCHLDFIWIFFLCPHVNPIANTRCSDCSCRSQSLILCEDSSRFFFQKKSTSYIFIFLPHSSCQVRTTSPLPLFFCFPTSSSTPLTRILPTLLCTAPQKIIQCEQRWFCTKSHRRVKKHKRYWYQQRVQRARRQKEANTINDRLFV